MSLGHDFSSLLKLSRYSMGLDAPGLSTCCTAGAPAPVLRFLFDGMLCQVLFDTTLGVSLVFEVVVLRTRRGRERGDDRQARQRGRLLQLGHLAKKTAVGRPPLRGKETQNVLQGTFSIHVTANRRALYHLNQASKHPRLADRNTHGDPFGENQA